MNFKTGSHGAGYVKAFAVNISPIHAPRVKALITWGIRHRVVLVGVTAGICPEQTYAGANGGT